eukprot:6458172-Amphidinium_carterae.1
MGLLVHPYPNVSHNVLQKQTTLHTTVQETGPVINDLNSGPAKRVQEVEIDKQCTQGLFPLTSNLKVKWYPKWGVQKTLQVCDLPTSTTLVTMRMQKVFPKDVNCRDASNMLPHEVNYY